MSSVATGTPADSHPIEPLNESKSIVILRPIFSGVGYSGKKFPSPGDLKVKAYVRFPLPTRGLPPPEQNCCLTPAQGEAYDIAQTPEPNRRASWHHRIRERCCQFGKVGRTPRQLRRPLVHCFGWVDARVGKSTGDRRRAGVICREFSAAQDGGFKVRDSGNRLRDCALRVRLSLVL